MRLCYNGLTTKYATLQQEVMAAHRAGFGYMELRGNKIEDYLLTHTPEQLLDFLTIWHMKVASINSIEICPYHENLEPRARLMEKLEWMCQIGQTLEADSLITAPLFNDCGWSSKQIDAFLVKLYREMSDIARPYGVKISFEIIALTGAMVPNLQRALEIIEKIDRDNVGLCLDCFAFHGNGSTLPMLEKINPARFFMLHLNDARKGVDKNTIQEKDRRFPGEGEINLPAILQAVKKKGYNYVASLELINPDVWEWNTETAISHGYQVSYHIVSAIYPDVC